jgi:tetratricopeptide (TPR) repeat protein
VWLKRSGDGKELWRESFDAELKDASLVYGQIARGVARTLDLRIPPVEMTPAANRTSSLPAYEAYLRGIYLRRHEQPEKAVAALQDAVLLDPDFAPAYAELAFARMSTPAAPDVGATEAAARRALELDSSLAEAHTALGQILFFHYLDWQGAGRELRRAVALNPGSADAYFAYSVYLSALGRHAQALAAVGRARELDPASMMAASNYAWYFYLDHRYEEAIRQARSVLELSPLVEGTAPQGAKMATYYSLDTLLNSAWKLGDRETALEAAKKILKILNRPEFLASRLSSPEEFWRGREERIQEFVRQGISDPYVQAKNAVNLGDRNRALDLLTGQCTPQGLSSPFAAVEPLFDSLHDDPRWGQVLDCLKLPADAPARKSQR